jgi:hypothetical protein
MPSNESAFPIPLDDRPGAYPAEPGMDLRDYFAAKAMQAWISTFQEHEHPVHSNNHRGAYRTASSVAIASYMMADAMLEVRNATK